MSRRGGWLVLQTDRARLHTTRTTALPPPCGGGRGRGVAQELVCLSSTERVLVMERVPVWTPLPNPPPQGGRERTARVAPRACQRKHVCSNIRGEVHELVEQHA